MLFVETKINTNKELLDIRNGNYKVWNTNKSGRDINRKLRNGIMIIMVMKNEVVVEKVKFSGGMTELINILILMKGGKKRDTATAYVSRTMNALTEMDFNKMVDETAHCVQRMIENSNIMILMSNRLEVYCQNLSTEGSEKSWGSRSFKHSSGKYKNTVHRGHKIQR